MATEERRVRFGGKEVGVLSISKLNRMAKRGDLDPSAEFWSEVGQCWRPLNALLTDFEPYPQQKIADMRAAGIESAEFDGAAPEDCAVCRELSRKRIGLDELPSIPPEGCTCFPWCACFYVVNLD